MYISLNISYITSHDITSHETDIMSHSKLFVINNIQALYTMLVYTQSMFVCARVYMCVCVSLYACICACMSICMCLCEGDYINTSVEKVFSNKI